mgnify:FL=1
MDSDQKYIEENNSVTLSMEAIQQLMVLSDKVRYRIFNIFEMIDNPIDGEAVLGLRVPNDENRDIYFEVDLYLQTRGEYNIYKLTPIDVDRYLDLLNEEKLLELNQAKCRTIV